MLIQKTSHHKNTKWGKVLVEKYLYKLVINELIPVYMNILGPS